MTTYGIEPATFRFVAQHHIHKKGKIIIVITIIMIIIIIIIIIITQVLFCSPQV